MVRAKKEDLGQKEYKATIRSLPSTGIPGTCLVTGMLAFPVEMG